MEKCKRHKPHTWCKLNTCNKRKYILTFKNASRLVKYKFEKMSSCKHLSSLLTMFFRLQGQLQLFVIQVYGIYVQWKSIKNAAIGRTYWSKFQGFFLRGWATVVSDSFIYLFFFLNKNKFFGCSYWALKLVHQPKNVLVTALNKIQ